MAQLVVSWFIYDGAIRVHAINAVGRRNGRIIEVEVVDTGEGSTAQLEGLSDWCRRFESPEASWTMCQPGHLTRPLEP